MERPPRCCTLGLEKLFHLFDAAHYDEVMSTEPEPHYERERRFLVADKSLIDGWKSVLITQAYVFAQDGYAVRIRLLEREVRGSGPIGLDATVTVKGPRIGDEREEYERTIDIRLAGEIIARSHNIVVKRRYQVHDGVGWDIDEFLADNAGLMIAELEGPDARAVQLPTWASREVTYDDRYNNDELAKLPFKSWTKERPAPDDVWDS